MASPSHLIKHSKSSPHYGDESSPNMKNFGTQLRNITVPKLPSTERRNWLIHLHYVRKDFDVCKSLIQEQLEETNNLCEYAMFIEGKILRREGKIQESLTMFKKCWNLNNSAENLKQIGRSLCLLGRKTAAIEAYSDALEINPDCWEITHNLGMCYIDVKEYSKAKEKLLRAIQIYPHSESFESLAKIFIEKGEFTKALETYKKAVEYCPDNTSMAATLGLLYLKVGQHQKAFEQLVSIPTSGKNNSKSQFSSGSILQSHGDVDEALDRYRATITDIPDSSYLWNNIGMCFYSKKKYVAAISCLKRAAYLAPSEWEMQYNLGLVHLTMQQYASAFHFLSAANNLKPQNPDTFMLLAVALKHLEDYDTAKTAFEQAISLGKKELVTPLNYAIFLDEIGEKSKAVQQLNVFNDRLKDMKNSNEKPDAEILDLAAKIKKVFQVTTPEAS